MNDTFKSIAAFRDSVTSPTHANPEWSDKMLHAVPDLPTVKDRAAYLIEKAKGRVVLDIGCTGAISQAIKAAAQKYYGVDQGPPAEFVVDLDAEPELLPIYPDVEVVILSEVLEHLANPGNFLKSLRQRYHCDIYITVPNAGAFTMKDNCEVVNKDHVAWYSYTTLATLLARYGFTVTHARWYHGEPYKAEGLIFLVT